MPRLAVATVHSLHAQSRYYTGVGVKAIELTIIASSNFSRPPTRKKELCRVTELSRHLHTLWRDLGSECVGVEPASKGSGAQRRTGREKL